MLTDLQRRKLTRMFQLLDGDRDGVLVKADYDRTSARVVDALGVAPASAEGRELVASYATEWGELQAEADRDAGGRVTLRGWLAYRDAQLSGPDAFEVMLDPYVEFVFSILDRDGDRRVSTDDVRRYLGFYRMPEAELDEAIARIDPDGRGSFTRDDVGRLVREFYLSDDPGAPGSWLLGPFAPP